MVTILDLRFLYSSPFIAFGKSDITSLIRNVLNAIRSANGSEANLCLNEFTRACLMDALKKCAEGAE